MPHSIAPPANDWVYGDRSAAAAARFIARVASRPALIGLLRTCMGAAVGAIFALITGRAEFWLAIGLLLGAGLDAALAHRQGAAPAVHARPGTPVFTLRR
jgi:hypothetical protein